MHSPRCSIRFRIFLTGSSLLVPSAINLSLAFGGNKTKEILSWHLYIWFTTDGIDRLQRHVFGDAWLFSGSTAFIQRHLGAFKTFSVVIFKRKGLAAGHKGIKHWPRSVLAGLMLPGTEENCSLHYFSSVGLETENIWNISEALNDCYALLISHGTIWLRLCSIRIEAANNWKSVIYNFFFTSRLTMPG